MRRTVIAWLICLSTLAIPVGAESVRALVAGELILNAENPEGGSINLASNGSVVIRLGNDIRFFRGVELEISAPQTWHSYRGSLAMELYTELNRQPTVGVNDLEGHRIAFEPLPDRLRIVYQIPIRQSHGLRSNPYASVPAGVTLPSSFPILFRLMPIIKGISEELENIRFRFTAKPIFSDEGAVKINLRYPEQLKGRPLTLLIDDVIIENPSEEHLLREGGHHLVILSDDYRNESRRFIVEKAKTLDLTVVLQDPTPIIIFEGPENARIYLNNSPVSRENRHVTVEPGLHEARIQIGDYTITKTITVQRGKTYRVALAVDIDIDESE